jgi:hypothetical protein
MHGRHTDRNGMLIGTPSQTNNYLDTEMHPKTYCTLLAAAETTTAAAASPRRAPKS